MLKQVIERIFAVFPLGEESGFCLARRFGPWRAPLNGIEEVGQLLGSQKWNATQLMGLPPIEAASRRLGKVDLLNDLRPSGVCQDDRRLLQDVPVVFGKEFLERFRSIGQIPSIDMLPCLPHDLVDGLGANVRGLEAIDRFRNPLDGRRSWQPNGCKHALGVGLLLALGLGCSDVAAPGKVVRFLPSALSAITAAQFEACSSWRQLLS